MHGTRGAAATAAVEKPVGTREPRAVTARRSHTDPHHIAYGPAVVSRSAFEVRASASGVMGHLIAAQLRELCPRSSITLSEDQNTVLSPGDVLVACTDTDRSLVVFGQSPAPHVVEMCLARGVWSMVTVDSPSEEFSVAVRTLVDGPSFVASSIVRALASAAVGAIQGNEHLTPREYEVLTLLADGLSNAEIANELCVSPNTVRTHVQSLFTKLEVGSRAKVVARARAAGLIP